MEGVTNRKDYSIDMKTEEIYRQFTSNSETEPQSKQTVKLGHWIRSSEYRGNERRTGRGRRRGHGRDFLLISYDLIN